jgi:hypothetical protein
MTEMIWKNMVWQQFGASIDMMENAIVACPDELWGNRSEHPEFWYTAFHAIFFLDCYLSESERSFLPPPPFTLDELDERGLLPDRVYSREELLGYLEHGRRKCRSVIAAITGETACQRCGFSWLDLSVGELLLYNMRHLQHHAAQLNLVLSQKGYTAPRWVRATPRPLAGP